jgi:hypothetical protein
MVLSACRSERTRNFVGEQSLLLEIDDSRTNVKEILGSILHGRAPMVGI